MDLFPPELEQAINVLPYDGEAYYYGEIFSEQLSQQYFQQLITTLEWQHDQALILGKVIETKRKVAWYANTHQDKPHAYAYSGITRYSSPFTKELLSIKQIVEEKAQASFNACLANLYHSGKEGMAWHSDNEQALKKHAAIASLSFGEARTFSFKHKLTKELISLTLKPGSLLVMKGQTQDNWLHRLPPSKKASNARINLTFRTVNLSL